MATTTRRKPTARKTTRRTTRKSQSRRALIHVDIDSLENSFFAKSIFFSILFSTLFAGIAGALSWFFNADWKLPVGVVWVVCFLSTQLILLGGQLREELLWPLELLLKKDLTGDKILGRPTAQLAGKLPKVQPVQPAPKPVSRFEPIGLGDIPEDRLLQALLDVAQTGQISIGKLMASGLGRPEADKVIAQFERLGFIIQRNQKSRNLGFLVTDAGKKFLLVE